MAPALLELLGDGSEPAAPDVLLFTREALQTFPDLRGQIYQVIDRHRESGTDLSGDVCLLLQPNNSENRY